MIDMIKNDENTTAAGKTLTASEILEKTIHAGINTLCEDDSKIILKQYGIPVVPEKRVTNPEEAAKAAENFGFPVVLKGLGSNISHKTEMGLVKVGLKSRSEVKKTADKFLKISKNLMEGLLVQPKIEGTRELVAGVFKDQQFGHVVMFGLGGIFTEAINDVVFRIAPLQDIDIEHMIEELSSKSMLDNFRGEKKADKTRIKSILKGLSDIAVKFPFIKEIDINPLIITKKGDLVAVDALVVTETEEERKKSAGILAEIDNSTLVDKKLLKSLFYPDSVAFIGASASFGKWGNMLPVDTLSGGFKGAIYLVNPKGGKILNKKVYKSICDIKGKVDLAVVTIPAHLVLGLIPELKEKKVKGMLLITAGFKETGQKGAELEKELTAKASDAGIVILGPNTMGVCNPYNDFFCSSAHVHPVPGSTALVSQSGNLGVQILAFAEQQGIGIRMFSGTGNEAMVGMEDYIEAFKEDVKTRALLLYIENVKNGKRFLKSAAEVSRKKPIVVLKGGRTKAGFKAAASHTGALASNIRVFDAACRQAGIIEAEQPMDLINLSAVFSSLPLPKGNRVAIMTLGGGWGVVTSDLCMEYGLEMPRLPEKIISKLDTILPSYWSHGNPVDIVGEGDPEIPKTTVEELLKWDGCDAVLHLGILGKRIFAEKMIDYMDSSDPSHSKKDLDFMREMLIKIEEDYVEHIARLTEKYEKPVIGVSILTDSRSKILYRIENCRYNSVFFPSPERAVKSLASMCRYGKWKEDVKALENKENV